MPERQKSVNTKYAVETEVTTRLNQTQNVRHQMYLLQGKQVKYRMPEDKRQRPLEPTKDKTFSDGADKL
jgi:hypothetical protein